MYQIKEYEEKYNEKVNDFIIKIYVDEYGFEEHRGNLEKHDNSSYKKSGGNLLLALDREENILGTIAITKHNENEAELKRFYVREDYRGTGLASKLYNMIIDKCKEKSISKISLGTFEKFEKAIKFYNKRGFNEISQGPEGRRYLELDLNV